MEWVFVVAGGLFLNGASLFGTAIWGTTGDLLPMILSVGFAVLFLGVVASLGIAAIFWPGG